MSQSKVIKIDEKLYLKLKVYRDCVIDSGRTEYTLSAAIRDLIGEKKLDKIRDLIGEKKLDKISAIKEV